MDAIHIIFFLFTFKETHEAYNKTIMEHKLVSDDFVANLIEQMDDTQMDDYKLGRLRKLEETNKQEQILRERKTNIDTLTIEDVINMEIKFNRALSESRNRINIIYADLDSTQYTLSVDANSANSLATGGAPYGYANLSHTECYTKLGGKLSSAALDLTAIMKVLRDIEKNNTCAQQINNEIIDILRKLKE